MSGIINSVGAKSGIIGSDVYPAGMVIQTINDLDRGTERSTSATAPNYVDVGGLSCAIESRGLNSKFSIFAHSGMSHTAASANMHMNIKRVITGGATTNELSGNLAGQTYYYGITHNRVKDWSGTQIFYIDTPAQAVGTTITYSLRFNGDGYVVNWLHAYGSASMIVQEIAV